jgi:chromosomal replication initiation ATPase DnaA
MQRKYILAARGIDIHRLLTAASELLSIPTERIAGPGQERNKIKARRLICYWAVKELGLSMTAVSKKLDIAVPTVSRSFQKGEELSQEEGIVLSRLLNIET